MNPLLAGGLVVAAAIVAAFGLILRSLLAPRPISVTPEWLRRFDAARYRPVERLLGDDDYFFLANQPGYTPSLARRLRAEHKAILKAYLSLLKADFDRLHHVAKLLVVYAEEDRPGMASLLLRHRFDFARSLLLVRLRLALPFVAPKGKDVSRLVRSLEWMRAQIPNQACAAA